LLHFGEVSLCAARIQILPETVRLPVLRDESDEQSNDKHNHPRQKISHAVLLKAVLPRPQPQKDNRLDTASGEMITRKPNSAGTGIIRVIRS
jgi:hypothetical protein